jgi:hypothetical protein
MCYDANVRDFGSENIVYIQLKIVARFGYCLLSLSVLLKLRNEHFTDSHTFHGTMISVYPRIQEYDRELKA